MLAGSRLMAAIATAAVALAGCAGSDGPATATGADTGSLAAAASLPAPVHSVGDAWEWTSPQLGTYTYAITGDQGGDFLVGTDSADLAFFNARSDVSTLGQMRQADLAGSQSIDGQMHRVEFFRFPLTANASWATTWDGQPVAIRVAAIDADSAELVARRSDGTTYATYTYEARHGYFGTLTFHDGAGAPAFSSSVARSLSGYSGPIRDWRLEQVVDFAGAMTGSASTTFQVPANITDVYVEARFECTTGNFAVAVGPPTGPAEERGYAVTDPCPLSLSENGPVSVAPAQDETWGALFTAVPGAQGEYVLRVFLRTLVES